ncbi:transducin/WD40 repeat-like superfamily protein isoform X2 [Wolffia australiana]
MEIEMEIEPVAAPPEPKLSSPSKRLAVKHTLQTNFGDEYVFQISSRRFRPWQYLCHHRAWDTRSFKQVSTLVAAPNQEVYSFGVGGSSGNLLAAGCNEQILFWDLRSEKKLCSLEDSHIEDVTQVRFVPDQPNKLISGSVDGLLCLFDTSGPIDDEDHLESVMNVGTSVSRIGFFGQNQKLWCLTHIETLSTWDWNDARQELGFDNARSLASENWNLENVDYFVDCFAGPNDDLWLIGGTNSGTLGYFPVGPGIGPVEATLEGGHSGVVRTILPSSSAHGSLSRSKGIFGWSGGEDGRLCWWIEDGASEAKQSWISASLVERAKKKVHKNHRHHPY